jgi:hypothetical protein
MEAVPIFGGFKRNVESQHKLCFFSDVTLSQLCTPLNETLVSLLLSTKLSVRTTEILIMIYSHILVLSGIDVDINLLTIEIEILHPKLVGTDCRLILTSQISCRLHSRGTWLCLCSMYSPMTLQLPHNRPIPAPSRAQFAGLNPSPLGNAWASRNIHW